MQQSDVLLVLGQSSWPLACQGMLCLVVMANGVTMS